MLVLHVRFRFEMKIKGNWVNGDVPAIATENGGTDQSSSSNFNVVAGQETHVNTEKHDLYKKKQLQ